MSLHLTDAEIATLTTQQAALLSDRLDDTDRLRRILTAIASLIGARRSFAAFTLGSDVYFVSDGVGPQIETYLRQVYRGFDRGGNVLMSDPDFEEINRRRRQMGAGVHHEAKLQLRERIESTSYFREAFAPAGMHHVIGLTAPLPVGEAVFAFGFAGADDPGFSGSRGVDILRLIVPAFESGFSAAYARAAAQAEVEAAVASLPGARLSTGVAPAAPAAGTVLPGPALPGHARSWIAIDIRHRGIDPNRIAQTGSAQGLTRRQTEVMALMLEGLSAAEIAGRLNISPHTARRHCEAVLTRLGIKSRAAIWSALSGSARD